MVPLSVTDDLTVVLLWVVTDIKSFNGRMFHRHFLLFTANLIFFILILSYVIYFVFVQGFLQKQYFQANVNNLNNVGNSVEYFLNKADDIALHYSLINREALAYAYKDIKLDYSFFQFLSRMRDQKFFDENINSTYIYYQNSGKIIDLGTSEVATVKDMGSSEKNSFLQNGNFYDTGWLDALKAKKFNSSGFILLNTRKLYQVSSEKNPTVYEKQLLNQHPNVNVITLIRPLENDQKNIKGAVIVNLNESVLSQYLESARTDFPQTSFIINSNGYVVSHSDKSVLNKDLSSVDYVHDIIGNPSSEGYFTGVVNGIKSEVIYVKSSHVEWIYISSIPYNFITRDLNNLTKFILIIVFLILGSAVVSLYFMTKRIYSPIEKIFEKIKGISNTKKPDMLKSEVKVVEALVDNFKQNYDHLGKMVFDNFYLLKYDFLNKLILGECSDEEKENGFREYMIDFRHDKFTVVNVEIDEYVTVLNSYKVQDIYLIKQAIINIAEEILNSEYSAVGTVINQRNISLILNTDTNSLNKTKLGSCLKNIADMVNKYLNVSISSGVGNIKYSLKDLRQAYNEAEAALANKLHKGKSTILYFDEVKSVEEIYGDSGIDDRLIDFIKAGQKEKCLRILEDMTVKIKESSLKRKQVENIFIEFSILIRKLLNNTEKSFDEVCGIRFSDVLGFIDSFETLDELKKYMEGILSSVCDFYLDAKRNHNEELIAKVISYIDNHYFEELSLDSVSSMLKLTPQYISKLIKDIEGINFLDYLTDVRIKKSKQLLLKTDLPVQQVAERVGYTCYRTYLEQFKVRTGMIPTQYRKFNNKIADS